VTMLRLKYLTKFNSITHPDKEDIVNETT
jgi:hypothetical protein